MTQVLGIEMVCDSAIGTALAVALASRFWDSYAVADMTPEAGTFLQEMERFLRRGFGTDVLVAAQVIVVDSVLNIVTVANAGFPCPVLVSSSPGQQTFVLRAHSTFLNAQDCTEFGTATIELNPGDSILMYSKGVLEIRDLMYRKYGIRKLLKMLRGVKERDPCKVVDLLMENMKSFQSGMEYENDIQIAATRLGR